MAKILIVDEEPVSRRFVAMVLRTGGHRVLQAADCDTARKLAASERPELVLVDILTPSMDGCQLVVDLCVASEPAAPRFLFRGAANMEAEARALARAFAASKRVGATSVALIAAERSSRTIKWSGGWLPGSWGSGSAGVGR